MIQDRLKQLKFISNIFQISLNAIKDTLGFETLTMIFRRVGEDSAVNVVKRLKGKYNSLQEFSDLLIKEVISPVIGENKGRIKVEGNKIIIELDACPYKTSGGFPIKDMDFFCHYTEGLFDYAYQQAFPDKKFELKIDGLISGSCDKCTFINEFQ